MYTNNICKPETILYYDDCELTNNLESIYASTYYYFNLHMGIL